MESAAVAAAPAANAAISARKNRMAVSLDAASTVRHRREFRKGRLAVGFSLTRVLWNRQHGESAHADEQDAKQKCNREQSAFVVDYAACHVRARDPDRNRGGGN